MENLIYIISILSLFSSRVVARLNDNGLEEVRVGLVVDLSSIEGKILETSFSLALSDFYGNNKGYRTRVTLSSRDSQGDPILALAAATDLLHTAKVEAIVGAQSLQEARLLAAISEKSKVPVISTFVPHTLSLNKYDHFIQLTHGTRSEAKGITKLIHGFNWDSVVVIYEDVDDWREGLQILVDHFQDDGIHIDLTTSFDESSLGTDYMVYQLRKLKSLRAAVFVVHMSEVLVSRLFRCAENLGMMEEGYAWILTARTMNHFHHLDHFVVRSMQRVIGFRSYIPESEELSNFTSRLRKIMVDETTAGMETKHFSVVISVWAHDIACILATAVEKIFVRASDAAIDKVSNIRETIRHSRFKGLSHGDIQITSNRFLSGTFEIMNIVGTREGRIGLWTCGDFCRMRGIVASTTNELETIIWPDESDKIPRHRFLTENVERKRLRVLVTTRNWFPHLVAMRANTFTGFCIEVFKTSMEPFNYELEIIPYDGNDYDELAYTLFNKVHMHYLGSVVLMNFSVKWCF
ncbi:hypothetical protein CARUB_v10016736mg [Capsella rubella]|uniref:Receptor ligand binding region domain-containing protein n=1 Tax=Capsella rubella TaxID=81985 RepID=R0FND8_9BRAS|nr:hypothetical protein CARUB_v10016736mg [Capsella rubella]EOA23541.1 hypothetical protein CARUB_v10016736mg [Capsella rubella]